MNYTLEILVATIEEIKDELYAIYLRKQKKMSAELKLSVKLIQDIRLRFGMINTNQTNWTCADCIFTVLGHSIIPFIESRKYEEIKEFVKPVDAPALVTVEQSSLTLEKEDIVMVKPRGRPKGSKNVKVAYV